MRIGLSAAALLLPIIGLAGEGQQPVPPFTASSDLVVVPAVVVDKKGAIVPGMKAEDFQVFEDGRPVEIATFVAAEAAVEGRFIVVVLDNLTTRAEIGFRVRDIAMKFVNRMGPSDVMSVIPLNRGRATTTGDKAALKAAIDRFTPAFGDSVRTQGQDASQGLRAISDLTAQVSRAPHPRKVMVFIGAASMFSPNEPSAFADRGPDLSPDWAEAIRSTARDNVSVYTIDPEGQTGQVDDYSQSFAVETGGQAWANTNNFEAAVDRIWRESRNYYLLGYVQPINDRRIHRIEVKVSKPGVTVRARRARG